jgi:hypothetical protein
MRLNVKFFSYCAFVLTALLFVSACTKEDALTPTNDTAIEERSLISGTPSVPLIGLTPDNQLVHLLSGPPVVEKGIVAITGLRPQEQILAIDYRYIGRELLGVSNESILYRINPTTGAATAVTGFPMSPLVEGTNIGMDVDPVRDIIRIVSSTGQNLSVSPLTGAVLSVDSLLNPGTPAVQSIAFTVASKFQKSALYDIDQTDQALFVQNPQELGRLEKVGSLGFTFEGEGAFEITNKNLGFAVQFGRSLFPGSNAGSSQYDVITEDAYRLLSINLTYGSAKSFGRVRPLIGLAAR